MGLAQSALVLLGIGIVSSRFKAGVGLGELGTGIQTLVAAPLTGTGTGLSTFAGGLRDLAESLGDLGRGFGALFENIPQLPTIPGTGLPGPGRRPPDIVLPAPRLPSIRPAVLIPDSGGNSSQLLPGGGGNTPMPINLPPMPAIRESTPSPPPVNYTPTRINNLLRDVMIL